MLREAAKAPALPEIPAPAALGTGVLPCQVIEGLIARRVLDADPPIVPEQIQPASIDLRLGVTITGLRCSTRHARRCAVSRATAAVHAIWGRASRRRRKTNGPDRFPRARVCGALYPAGSAPGEIFGEAV